MTFVAWRSLEGLNSEQRDAVETLDQNVMVFAGPGTGKTKTITQKIAYILERDTLSRCRKVLALTFTNKAAGEMKSRIRQIEVDSSMVRITTFHNFCTQVLRSYGDFIGLDRHFSFITNKQAYDLADEVMERYTLRFRSPKDFLKRLSQLKVSSSHYTDFLSKISHEIEGFESAALDFQNSLRVAQLCDFDDVLLNTLTLFQDKPYVLQAYQRTFPYVLIDEMQDTNTVQLLLIKKIGEAAEHITAVADDDQMIYRWRGALPEVIENYMEHFKARQIILENNYRSPQVILSVAEEVISPVDHRMSKNLIGRANEPNDCAQIRSFSSDIEEAEWVARKVSELLDEGLKISDIAILYRSYQSSFSMIEEAFEKCDIPFKFTRKGLDEADTSLADQILEAASLLVNPRNHVALVRILNQLGERFDVEHLAQYYIDMFQTNYDTLLDRLVSLHAEDELDKLVISLAAFIASGFRQVNFRYIYDELYNILRIDGALTCFKEEKRGKEAENLLMLRERWVKTRVQNLRDLLTELWLNTAVDFTTQDDKWVKGMSIHSVKGLEFKAVCIVGLEEFIIPGRNASARELADERRNLYVGITRSRSKLYMSYCEVRHTQYGPRRQSMCPFLKDIRSAERV